MMKKRWSWGCIDDCEVMCEPAIGYATKAAALKAQKRHLAETAHGLRLHEVPGPDVWQYTPMEEDIRYPGDYWAVYWEDELVATFRDKSEAVIFGADYRTVVKVSR